MKILSLSGYFYPEIVSSSYLRDNTNEALIESGFDLVVYTPIPTRGVTKEIRKKYKHIKYESLYNGHLTVHRYNLIRECNNPIQRAFRYTISCIKQFNRGVFARDARKCDVMLISSTPPILGATAAIIKILHRIPMIYNLQDVFSDSIVSTEITAKGSIFWRIACCIENFTYRQADKIIVISEDMKFNIMSKGVPEGKIEVINNWVDTKTIVPVNKDDNVLFDELGLSRDKFYIVYAGNFGKAQNIDVILRAALKLQHFDQILFLLFGTGGMKSNYENMVLDMGLTNVRFFPLLPYKKTSFVYSLGNVGIVSCKKGLGRSAMPSKTWSIMATGRPIIANYDTDTELERIILQNRVGQFSDADNDEELAKMIRIMYEHPNMCEEYGNNARNFVITHLTKEVGVAKIINVIQNVCNSTKTKKEELQ